MKAPPEIEDKALVLMADIFPTGYFAAHNAFKDMTKEQIKDATVILIGCGYDSRIQPRMKFLAHGIVDPSDFVLLSMPRTTSQSICSLLTLSNRA